MKIIKNNTAINTGISALALAVMMGFSVPAFADTGILKFQITDKSGQPIAGAVVNVKTPDSLSPREGITDKDGNVRLVGLDPSSKYQVAVVSDGYLPFTREHLKVVSGKSFSLNFSLLEEDATEVIEVVGRHGGLAQIDTSSATVGVDITLDLTESLPTGRSYQSYLQLAPGTKPSLNGNPSSKSGVNYSDAVDSKGNTSGNSTDNLYYIDNVNVTDGQDGGYGAQFNSEIIQEQIILTGGLPAEYAGGSGLVSRVVTKSGSNEFHGSVNYYAQSDSLVADNKHLKSSGFSTYDTAFTLGGPIIKDELWFYSSYQVKNREDDITDPDTGDLLRSVSEESDLGFFKLTWQATANDKFVATYFNDPTDISGSDDETVPNNRDTARKQGGDNYHFQYSHVWDDVILTLDVARHEAEASRLAADTTTRNDVAYLNGDPSAAELSRGGYGQNIKEFRNRDSYQITLDYFLDTDNFGSHEIKTGLEYVKNTRKLDFYYTGDGAQYTSIANANSGTSLDTYTNDEGWTGALDIVSDDYARILSAMESSGDYATYLALLDADNDGSINNSELGALTFSNTSGNPNDLVNVYRIDMVETAAVEFETKGTSFFIQDTWLLDGIVDGLTINAGVRAEKWEHFSTTGEKIFTFDWELAPRLSAIYDINDDGESKVWAFYGRYYDPIRTDMTSFAGTFTGPVRDEQINVNGDWLTFRTRGPADGMFAPNTKTPYTDEIVLGYSQNVADDMSVEVTYTQRDTKDILEDYDLDLYTNVLAGTDYELPLSYFGFDEMPNSNYTIATLKGGKREYKGYELTFRKHRTLEDNWQLLSSYTYNDAKGNSNSDGNADFQGDVVWLDPRSPGMWGEQPGNIEHLFKIAGSYFFDNGIEIGAVYNWNSGIRYSETWSVSGRHLPLRVDEAFEDGGVNTRWIDGEAVGAHTSDSYGTLDLRVKYSYDITDRYTAEFFLDIFNVLDDQAVTREQDLSAGDGTYAFGKANAWVEPRRLYLGTRVSF